jgi:hypothetical protein
MKRVLAVLLLLIQAQPLFGAAMCAYDRVTAQDCGARDEMAPLDAAVTQAGPLHPAHCDVSAICAPPVVSLHSARIAADFFPPLLSSPPGWLALLKPDLAGPPPAPPPRV